MSNLKLLAYDITTTLGKPNDFAFTKLVESHILSDMALLARREYEKTGKFPNDVILEIPCVPLTKVDASECCDVELDCKVLRTTYKIPETVTIKDQINFITVTDPVRSRKYGYLNPARIGYNERKFKVNDFFYSFLNRYIYIFDTIEPEYINIVALFADPREWAELKNCYGGFCFDKNKEVIIPSHYVSAIREMVLVRFRMRKSPEVEINEEK